MNDNVKTKEEEISLFDLFTVLLRYRKLIIGITLVFIILAVAGYFVYPEYQYKKEKAGLLSQGKIQIEIAPRARPYVSQSLDKFIFRSDLIYDSLYAAGMKNFSYQGDKIPLDDENKVKIMYLIDMLWIKNIDPRGDIYFKKEQDKIFNVTNTGTKENISKENISYVYEVSLKNKDKELIEKFLYSIYRSVTVNVENNMRSSAQIMVNNYERLIRLTGASESIKSMLEKDFDTYTYFKDFLDGKEIVVRLVSEPVFVEGINSLSFYKELYPKTGIIFSFAGLFLALMLSFVLNAIRIIKHDEEAMKKIRDALENSDSK